MLCLLPSALAPLLSLSLSTCSLSCSSTSMWSKSPRNKTTALTHNEECWPVRYTTLSQKWWADSMECYTHLRNIQDLQSDGKTPYERVFGKPFNGPVIPFGAMVEYHPISAKDISRLHQFGKKVLLRIFLDYVLYAGGIWKGDIMVADIEELEEMDASELHARRLNAKEVLTPKSGFFAFLIANGKVKLSGGDQVLRSPTLSGTTQTESKSKKIFEDNPDLSSSAPRQYSTWYDGEVKEDFWFISGDSVYRHHVEPRVKLHVPKEESFLVPLKYIDVSRTTHTQRWTLCWRKYWRFLERGWRENYHRDRELSDTWTGFTTFTFVEWKATGRIYVVQEETDKKTNDLKTR